jgi:hypothetical protein
MATVFMALGGPHRDAVAAFTTFLPTSRCKSLWFMPMTLESPDKPII